MNLKEQRKQEAKKANVVAKLQLAGSIATEFFGEGASLDAVHTIYGFIRDRKPATIDVFKSRLRRTCDFIKKKGLSWTPELALETHAWIDDTDDEDILDFVEAFDGVLQHAGATYHPRALTLEMVLFMFDEFHGEDEDEEE